MKFVREQFFLAAAAQTIKRLVRFLSQVPTPPLAVTTQFPTLASNPSPVRYSPPTNFRVRAALFQQSQAITLKTPVRGVNECN